MGLAYLPDGTMIDYREYIQKHPRWKKVRDARFKFDNGCCAVCHTDLTDRSFQTHHLSYQRLGHERIRDVITLCDACHKEFHQNWNRIEFWRGKEEGHWNTFNLLHTARLCAHYWKQDRLINRDTESLNLCSNDVCIQLIDTYFREFALTEHPVIDPHDISLFVRNKRYELFFEAEKRGLSVEEFLDEYYGEKVRGKNPIRQEAGRKNGPFDHTPDSFHRHYSENKNLNILMEEVKNIETGNKTEHEDDTDQILE